MNGELFLKWIPAISAYVVAASLAYCTGTFQVIGALWMEAVTFQDLMTASASGLPYIGTVAVLISAAYATYQHIVSKYSIIIDDFGNIRKIESIFFGFLFIFPIIVILTFPELILYSPRVYLNVLPFLAIIPFIVSPIIARTMIRSDYYRNLAISFGAISLLFLAYCMGIQRPLKIYEYGPQDMLIFTKGNQICSNVLFLGERNVVISDSIYGPRYLFRRDDIKIIARNTKCKPTQRVSK